MKQTIFPILRYNDARTAIEWLCAAFGFREIFSVPETGDYVRHAQLGLESNLIMVGSIRDDGLKSPRSLGAATQALYVHVSNVDEHFERTRAADAEIVEAPTATDFGSRQYHALDLEGHSWTFGDYLPNGDA